ncbi:MAG TPA: hypothetical protein VGH56_09330, partial [Solirubrobacteraceae bacterium]
EHREEFTIAKELVSGPEDAHYSRERLRRRRLGVDAHCTGDKLILDDRIVLSGAKELLHCRRPDEGITSTAGDLSEILGKHVSGGCAQSRRGEPGISEVIERQEPDGLAEPLPKNLDQLVPTAQAGPVLL